MPGTLEVCPGTWYARILVRADVVVRGLGSSPEDTVLSGGESGTILDVAGPDVLVRVENLTLDRGAGLDVEHNSGGGGLYCEQEGEVFVEQVRFTRNQANDGAAIYTRDCTLDVSDSSFIDNHSEDDGGAITLWTSTAHLTDVTLRSNTALDGGAMAIFQSEVDLTRALVQDNRGRMFSGALWVYESSLEMTDSQLLDNTNDGGEYGGALIVHGSAVLQDVVISGTSNPRLGSSLVSGS